jgi:hypothetical protein
MEMRVSSSSFQTHQTPNTIMPAKRSREEVEIEDATAAIQSLISVVNDDAASVLNGPWLEVQRNTARSFVLDWLQQHQKRQKL